MGREGVVARGLAALVGVGCALVSGAPAVAHSPPQIDDVLWTADGSMVLVTNRGLVFERQEGADRSWALLCGAAFGVQVDERFEVAALADGRLFAATSHGLIESNDNGCSWSVVQGTEQAFATSLVRDASGDRLFVALAAVGQSRIERSDDGGAQWRPVMMVSDLDIILQLAIAPSDRERIYASGYRLESEGQSPRQHVLYRSSDAGETWEMSQLPVSLGVPQGQLLVSAIHPQDPDRVLLAFASDHDSDTPLALLLSEDGGRTFAVQAMPMGLSDASFDRAGDLWIASDEGLQYIAAGADLQSIGDAQLMTSLTLHDGQLYVSGHYNGFSPVQAGLGVLQAGGVFTTLVRFVDIKEPAACPVGSSAATACAALWYDWQSEVLVGLGELSPDALALQPTPLQPGWSAAIAPSADAEVTTSGCTVGSSGSRRSLVVIFVEVMLCGLWVWRRCSKRSSAFAYQANSLKNSQDNRVALSVSGIAYPPDSPDSPTGGGSYPPDQPCPAKSSPPLGGVWKVHIATWPPWLHPW